MKALYFRFVTNDYGTFWRDEWAVYDEIEVAQACEAFEKAGLFFKIEFETDWIGKLDSQPSNIGKIQLPIITQ
jgi:hypothetical protein